jgi:hypothetical protein
MATSFLPPAIFEIKAIADEAIAKFGDVNKELEKMEGQAEKAGGSVSKLDKASRIATAGLLAMGAAFVGFASYGIKEAIDAEKQFNKLGQTLSNLGLSTKQNREDIKELTDSYVDLGFGGEEAGAGLDVLLRATGDLDESQKLLAMSADLARTKNIGLSEASSILAKASQGNARAFKEMGITLDETLPKNEALNKAMAELNARIGGQAIAYTKTFQGQLAVTREKFNDVAESLGAQLLPYLKQFLDLVSNAIEFAKRNASTLKIVGGVILTVTAALAAYNLGVKVSIALTKAWGIITKAQAIATAVLTGQQKLLNVAMKANPIGLIFTAATLLIGAFVMLWNKSETFRKAVIQVGKAGLMAFASIVPILGKVGEAILKVVLTPLKTLLSALSKLPGVGKYAKAGLDLLNKGLDGVSDFADSASAKAKSLAANLDKLNKPIKIGGGKGIEIPDFGNSGKGGKGKGKPKETEAQKKLREDNEKYMEIVKDLNDKVSEAQKDFNEEMLEISDTYNKRVKELNIEADERRAELRADANERIMKLEASAAKARLKAEEDKNKKILEAQNRFTETVTELTKNRTDDLAKLERDKNEKIAQITEQGNEKLQGIIQQGINRLRDAYKKGTEFNVGDLFKGLIDAGEASADGLLKKLKDRLLGARKLAENASKLSGAGFTQTFIEQIVSQGPEIGNQLSEALLKATPETLSALQETYMSLEDLSDTGLDTLAKSMNDGGQFATAQLAEAYEEARKDISKALAEVNRDYITSQTAINEQFNAGMLQAEKTRDAAIASARADFDIAIAEINKELQESIAEVQADLVKALAEVDKNLTKALAKAHEDMVDAQEKARKKLAESLAAIEKEFNEKLGNIKNAIASTMAAIASLQTSMALAQSKTSVTTLPYTGGGSITTLPYTGGAKTVPASFSPASFRAAEEKSMATYNITQNFTATKVDAYDVHEKTIMAMKLGSPVTVPVSKPPSTSNLTQRTGGSRTLML